MGLTPPPFATLPYCLSSPQVAASGPLGFAGACTAVIDPLLDALLGDEAAAAPPPLDLGSATLGGGLAVLHAAAAALAAAPGEMRRGEAGAPHPLQLRLPRIVTLLQAVERRVTGVLSSSSSEDESQQMLAAQCQIWALRLRLQLLLLAVAADGGLALPQAELDASLQLLVAAALQVGGGGGSSADASEDDAAAATTELWLDWDAATDPAAEAMSAIQRLAAPAPAAAADAPAAPVDHPALAAAVGGCVEALLLPALKTAAAGCALSVLQLLAGGEHGGAWQLLAWLHPLVVQELPGGSPSQRDLLTPYLECIHRHALAQLPLDLPPHQAAEAAAKVDALLAALSTRFETAAVAAAGADGSSARPTQLALQLASRLAARCSLEAQGLLLLTAGEWAAEADAAAGGGRALTPAAAGKAAMASALLIGMRPELLRGDSMRDVATALARVAIAPGAGVARAPAAVALGAVVNKWQPSSGGGEVAAAASLALGLARDLLLPSVAAAVQQQQDQQDQQGGEAATDGIAAAVACVAWMARGLAMVRCDAWQELTGLALGLLPSLSRSSSSSSGAARATATVGEEAVAGCFDVLVNEAPTDGGGSEGWRLDARAARTRTRPLWQQKTFVLALKALGARAAEAAAALSAAASGAGGAGAEGPAAAGQLEWALQAVALAMASLMSSAPRGVYRSAAEAVAVQLVTCMVQLAAAGPGGGSSSGSGGSAARDQRLHACALVVSDFLTDPSLLPLLERDVDGLVRLLLALSAWGRQGDDGEEGDGAGGGAAPFAEASAASAAVRETALQCLMAVMQVPYRLLHPHRRAVLRAITAALDDDRRAVRLAAVRARRVWGIT
jgi:hypothetical protein